MATLSTDATADRAADRAADRSFDRRWAVSASIPLLVFLAWVVTGTRGPDRLELPRRAQVDTALVLATASAALSLALLACAVSRIWGLVLLGLVLLSCAGFWPIVQDNRYSGPVIFEARRHGVHVNDALSVVPGALGVAMLVLAVRRRGSRDTTQRE